MLQNQHAQAAEMHINAAYAHAAAGCEHSTGDHLSTQDLARTAYERAQEAAQQYLDKQITKDDLVAIMLYTSMINVLTDFTADREVLSNIIQNLPIGEMSELAGLADLQRAATKQQYGGRDGGTHRHSGVLPFKACQGAGLLCRGILAHPLWYRNRPPPPNPRASKG